MKLKNDKHLRDKLFTPESYQHPAKGHLGLWEAIIEKYTLPGDTILDPMAGVGATLTAALMGRNVVCGELEPHFIAPMRASWEKMRQHPMLGYTLGQVLILRGDARALPIASADQFTNGQPILTSEVQRNDGGWTSRTYRFAQVRLQDTVDTDNDGTTHPSDAGSGPADAIITSPPWEDKTALQDSNWLYKHEAELAERFRQSHVGQKGLPGNTKPENRSTMEGYARPVDAVVSSPPYQAEASAPTSPNHLADIKYKAVPYKDERADHEAMRSPITGRYERAYYENIGNLRGGDLYALLVYNRLRQEPNQPVEVHLCGKCLPARIAESLPALTTPDVIAVLPSGTPKITPTSRRTSKEASGNMHVQIVEPSLPDGPLGVAHVQEGISPSNKGGSLSLPHGAQGLEHPTMASPSQNKQEQTTLHGREAALHGEVLLGVSSDGQCLNETTTFAQDAELRKTLLSIISKMQKKLAENGITASETWLQSVAPATTVNMPSTGCLLCNASLVANRSSQEMPSPNTALSLRFVEPRLIPLNIIAGKRSDYWTSMALCYAECHRVLRPGGILALVLKGFTRDGKYVDLPQQTSELVESLGFTKFDEWHRELWSLSFWRILQRRKDPAAFDDRLNYETVLAFRKPMTPLPMELPL